MSKPNFQTMTLEALKAYVLENRTDEDAIHEMVLRSQASGKTIPIERFNEELRNRLRQGSGA